jgi:uncharacterized membrane protein
MKQLIWLALLGAGLALAACEEPAGAALETAPLPMDAEAAKAADDQGVPTAETGAAVDPLPADSVPLPPEQQASEQTVRPESETLFY